MRLAKVIRYLDRRLAAFIEGRTERRRLEVIGACVGVRRRPLESDAAYAIRVLREAVGVRLPGDG